MDQSVVGFALIGGMMFVIGYLLWRSSVMRSRIAQQDDIKDMQKEISTRSRAPESVIHEMEVRLFDYGREVEGRIENTLSVLDRLIVDADQEIGRLEELLKLAQESANTPQTLSMNQSDSLTQRLPELIAVGLSNQEIARCLNCSLKSIEKYRKQFDNDQQSDAA